MYAVNVIYQNQSDNTRLWTYKVDDSISLAKEDKVVVPVLEDFIFKVATVVEVIKEPQLKSNIDYRWVAQKLDLTTYNKRLAVKNIKHLTWDDLADFYHKKTGGHARTKQMDTIYDWAIKQPEILILDDEGSLGFNTPKVGARL